MTKTLVIYQWVRTDGNEHGVGNVYCSSFRKTKQGIEAFEQLVKQDLKDTRNQEDVVIFILNIIDLLDEENQDEC